MEDWQRTVETNVPDSSFDEGSEQRNASDRSFGPAEDKVTERKLEADDQLPTVISGKIPVSYYVAHQSDTMRMELESLNGKVQQLQRKRDGLSEEGEETLHELRLERDCAEMRQEEQEQIGRIDSVSESIRIDSVSESINLPIDQSSSLPADQTIPSYDMNGQINEWKASYGTRCINRSDIMKLRSTLDEAELKVEQLECVLRDRVVGREDMVFVELREAQEAQEAAETAYEEFLPKFLYPEDVEEFEARFKPEL